MSDYIKREDALEQFDYYDLSEYLTTQIRGMLMDVPSADVAPVRHGRWELDEETDSFFCSECNSEALLKAVVIGGCLQELSEYCPNCGASMDKERRDDDESCDTCKYYDDDWCSGACDGCTRNISYWERKEDE